MMESGKAKSYYELARYEGMNPGHIRRLMRLAFLSPSLVEAVLDGHPLKAAGVVELTSIKIPLSWRQQHLLLMAGPAGACERLHPVSTGGRASLDGDPRLTSL